MAHFAELDKDNKVLRVIVISNDVTHNQDGVEVEQLGIDFCKSLYEGDTNWVQTSYNSNFRKIYAMEGDLYDSVNDEFICTPEDKYFTGEVINSERVQSEIEAPPEEPTV